MMGWMYFVVCITDFILFPMMWAVFKASIGETVEAWEPLTLQGAGLFHVAMGAILGVAAWSRGREKIAGVTGGPGYFEPQPQYRHWDSGEAWPESNRGYRPKGPSRPYEPEL